MRTVLICLMALVVGLVALVPSSADARVVIHNHYHRTPAIVAVAPVLSPAAVTVTAAPAPDTVVAPTAVLVVTARPKPQPGTVTVDPSSNVTAKDMRRAHKLARHGHNVQIN